MRYGRCRCSPDDRVFIYVHKPLPLRLPAWQIFYPGKSYGLHAGTADLRLPIAARKLPSSFHSRPFLYFLRSNLFLHHEHIPRAIGFSPALGLCQSSLALTSECFSHSDLFDNMIRPLCFYARSMLTWWTHRKSTFQNPRLDGLQGSQLGISI